MGSAAKGTGLQTTAGVSTQAVTGRSSSNNNRNRPQQRHLLQRQRQEQQQLDPRPNGLPAEPQPSPGGLPPGPENYYAVLARGTDKASSGLANALPLESDAVVGTQVAANHKTEANTAVTASSTRRSCH